MTHVPEAGAGKIESIFGAGFWGVCQIVMGIAFLKLGELLGLPATIKIN